MSGKRAKGSPNKRKKTNLRNPRENKQGGRKSINRGKITKVKPLMEK